MMRIPTAADGKKWVLLTAGLIAVAESDEGMMTGRNVASMENPWEVLADRYRDCPDNVSPLFADFSQHLWKEGHFEEIRRSVTTTIEEIVREFVVEQVPFESLQELSDSVARRWECLIPAAITPEDLPVFLQRLALSGTTEPMGLRYWQAVAAYLCRREVTGAATIAYLSTPMIIDALAHRLAMEFPRRIQDGTNRRGNVGLPVWQAGQNPLVVCA